MGLFSRRRDSDHDRTVLAIRGDGTRADSDPGVYNFSCQTDKEVARYGFNEDHEYVYVFADGSWANATTGEFCDTTGEGFLYTEPHWCR